MSRACACVAIVLLGIGCAANKDVAAPQSVREPTPTSIDEAQAQISQAASQLGTAPAGASMSAAPKSDAQPAQPQAAPPMDAPRAQSADNDHDGIPDEPKVSACGATCRAIGSMRRAVLALCRMSGNDDPRCADAQRTLEQSELRAAPCGC